MPAYTDLLPSINNYKIISLTVENIGGKANSIVEFVTAPIPASTKAHKLVHRALTVMMNVFQDELIKCHKTGTTVSRFFLVCLFVLLSLPFLSQLSNSLLTLLLHLCCSGTARQEEASRQMGHGDLWSGQKDRDQVLHSL